MDSFGNIVSYGIRDESIEMPVDVLDSRISSFADRDMCDIQKYLDQHYSCLELTFHYKEVEIDFKECTL